MVSSCGATTAPPSDLSLFLDALVNRQKFLYAVRGFFNKFLDRAMDRISSIRSASAVATCRPCDVNR